MNLVAQRLTHQGQTLNTLRQGEAFQTAYYAAQPAVNQPAYPGSWQQPPHPPRQPAYYGNQRSNANYPKPKPNRYFQGNNPGYLPKKRKKYVCPERKRLDQWEGVIWGMVGDLRNLRDHVVAQFDLRPVGGTPLWQNGPTGPREPPPIGPCDTQNDVYFNPYDVNCAVNKDTYVHVGVEGGGVYPAQNNVCSEPSRNVYAQNEVEESSVAQGEGLGQKPPPPR